MSNRSGNVTTSPTRIHPKRLLGYMRRQDASARRVGGSAITRMRPRPLHLSHARLLIVSPQASPGAFAGQRARRGPYNWTADRIQM